MLNSLNIYYLYICIYKVQFNLKLYNFVFLFLKNFWLLPFLVVYRMLFKILMNTDGGGNEQKEEPGNSC